MSKKCQACCEHKNLRIVPPQGNIECADCRKMWYEEPPCKRCCNIPEPEGPRFEIAVTEEEYNKLKEHDV